MRTKTLVLLLSLAFIFVGFVGCDLISFRDPAEKHKEAISKFISDSISKDVTGKTGETYQTKWFEFTVPSIEKVADYAGRRAEKDHQLYKVQISVKNNREEPIPMGTFDFYMDAPDFDEYIWAIPPLDDSMMPEDFILEPGNTVQYVMIFEVPIGAANLSFSYTESDASGNDGATYSIRIK
jgi:hypothetical protein